MRKIKTDGSCKHGIHAYTASGFTVAKGKLERKVESKMRSWLQLLLIPWTCGRYRNSKIHHFMHFAWVTNLLLEAGDKQQEHLHLPEIF